MKKSLFSIAVAIMAVVMLTAGSVEARTWKISHIRPQGTTIDNDLKWYADAVKKATDGKIKIKVYAASALGDYTIVQERVGLGAVDMACQPVSTGVDKRLQIISFPYLMKDWKQAQKNFVTGSPLHKTISGLFAEQDIRVMAAYPVYFGGVALKKEPKNPEDPNGAKGLKLRVPPAKTFQLLADNIGFIGTPLPFSEAFTAVQTGVVDGVIGSGAEGYYASFRDVTKYYMPVNTHFEVWYLIMNQELFADLSTEQQQQLEKVSFEFEQRRWKNAQKDQVENEKKLAEYGAEIIPVSDEAISAMAAKIRKVVWPEIQSDIGTEWSQKVLDSIIQ